MNREQVWPNVDNQKVKNISEWELLFLTVKNFISKQIQDIFFSQNRVWFLWQEFSVYKLRTMLPDAETRVPIELTLTGSKQENDPRIIPSRKWMRKSWVDEIPQIVNIFKWEMWLFGSRPMTTGIYDNLTPWNQKRFTQYKPGIFWWYAFVGKWKNGWNRTNNQNQEVYLRLRYVKEKQWKWEMMKYHSYVLIENIKALFCWVNR